MKIMGISGAQGQGKSTTINELVKECPEKFSKINIQTSREILQEWGYKLHEVNSFIPLKVRFQDELLKRHRRTLQSYKNNYPSDGQIFLVERTFADIFTYALVTVGPFNDYSAWLNNYYEECCQAQSIFSSVIYLSGRDYIPENDGVRSTNEHFTKMVDALVQKYSVIMGGNGLHFVKEPYLYDRVSLIKNIGYNLNA